MKLTAEVVDEVMKRVQSYGREHIGRENGPDFAEMMEAVQSASQWQPFTDAAGMMGLMSVLLMPRDSAASDEQRMAQFRKANGVASMIATAIYIGYCLGKREAELETLESMCKDQKQD